MTLSEGRRRALARLRRRKTRERDELVLVEGPRAVREALAAGARARFALVSPRLDEVAPGLAARLAESTDVVPVDDVTLSESADTASPQGVLLVVEQPRDAWLDRLDHRSRVLVLDALQDPGNVGTLIRSAAAFDLDGVILLDGSVDPWNPKAVRASAGAVFRCGVAVRPWADVAGLLERRGLPLQVADADGEPTRRLPWQGGWVLAVGSEARGARPEVREAAAAMVRVPMPGGTESLNAAVAGSILLYELTRLEEDSPA